MVQIETRCQVPQLKKVGSASASLGCKYLAVPKFSGAGVKLVTAAILDGRDLHSLVFGLDHCCAHARICRFFSFTSEETGQSFSETGNMEQYDPFEAQGKAQDIGPSFEDSLVEALDSNVQYSVNKALAKALGPLTLHLKGFARQQGWLPSLQFSESTSLNPNPGGKAKGKSQGKHCHSDAFEQFSASGLADHGYSHSSQATTSNDNSNYPDALSSDSSFYDSSDSDQVDLPGPNDSDPGPSPPKVLTFDPTEIVHPRSSNWVPLPQIASYVQCHLCQGFDKDVRARLRSECPRPDLTGKVSDTPEVDLTMVTFLKKWSKDPKKGLDRTWVSGKGIWSGC
ncbi:hypothetical protein NDU88_004778 [Pleurodeles waltl]|uniref:Uncharacterized protein n=1 Tax=Pleurodeles waltl TaxID=8319 RepID=A0AAV7NQA6_PLEWA|nr:hypothetical protein NDU88_004778 [Pleurodeles waltl]